MLHLIDAALKLVLSKFITISGVSNAGVHDVVTALINIESDPEVD